MDEKNTGGRSHEGFLALGSNLGDRERYLTDAIDSLRRRGIEVEEQSPVYETKAVGYADQPDFLNMVVRIRTELAPVDLLAGILKIEQEHGRVRLEKWGPRTLDLDILFYDRLVINVPDLIIPHPRMQERAFVLFPLRDLAPDFVHPVLGLTVAEMAEHVAGQGGVRRWEKPSASDCVPIEN